MESKYLPYDESELHLLLHEPWEVRDQPYMLHAAFALNALYEMCCDPLDDEDDTFTNPDNLWGCTVSKTILNRLVNEIATDFNDAAEYGKTFRVWGRPYSVRKVNAYDHNRLHLIFNFPTQGEDYVITKTGVLNLAKTTNTPEMLNDYEVTREQAAENRLYVRQIIKLAEDDENNGWDKLTDMEIVLYCWALFYNKYQYNNFSHFKKEYKDYLYVSDIDIQSCYNAKAMLHQRPSGMYSFSKEKVLAWNETHNQQSVAISISKEDADNYWYDIACNTTFRPFG